MHPVLSPVIFRRGSMKVNNRCVLAALTNKQSHDDGRLSEEEQRWLVERAIGGFGIVTTAATHVTQDGQGWSGELGVWSDLHIPNLSVLARELRQHGAVSLAQLFHGGMRAPEAITGQQPMTASETPLNAHEEATARGMTAQEVEETIEAFATAAKRCERAGFDGVELHGAHGYLIAQFMTKRANQRTDRWGLAKDPIAFLRAIVHRVRERTGPSFLVGVRLSPKLPQLDFHFPDALKVLDATLSLELDFIHLSCWNIDEEGEFEGRNVPFTTWYAEKIDGLVPLITTGTVWTGEDAQRALDQGADLVGVGRVGIAHPNWPRLLEQDAAIQRPPFTEQHLSEAALSPVFIEYMRRWDGFVNN